MHVEYGGIWGLIVLALDVWAIINIAGSRGDTLKKVVWILVVLLLPVLGFIVWLIAGPRSPKG